MLNYRNIWRVVTFVVVSFILVARLNSATVLAADASPNLDNFLFLPSVVGSQEVEQMDRFRSYGGRFEILPSDEISIWGGEIGGNPYPELTAQDEAVIWGAIKLTDGFNIAIHSVDMGAHEGAFKINMGYTAPFIQTRMALDGNSLFITRNGVDYLVESPITLDGCNISRTPEGNGFKYECGTSTFKVQLQSFELYLEGQIPAGTASFGAWAYSLKHEGEIDPEFETHVIQRYSLTAE